MVILVKITTNQWDDLEVTHVSELNSPSLSSIKEMADSFSWVVQSSKKLDGIQITNPLYVDV